MGSVCITDPLEMTLPKCQLNRQTDAYTTITLRPNLYDCEVDGESTAVWIARRLDARVDRHGKLAQKRLLDCQSHLKEFQGTFYVFEYLLIMIHDAMEKMP